MDQARLIRTVRFRASHHYRRKEWSEAENRRVFGAQYEPHEHEWRVEVHVLGPLDDATGRAADLDSVDRALAGALEGWDGGDLNAKIPEAAGGNMVPSTEALARWLYHRLGEEILPPAYVAEVRVYESETLGAAYPG